MPRPRPRRRRPVRVVALALLFGLLAWLGVHHGFGPAPHEPEPAPHTPPEAARPDPTAAVDGGPRRVDGGGGAVEPTVAEPGAGGRTEPAAVETGPLDDVSGAVEDRLWGLLSAIEGDVPDRAFAACAAAARLDLDADQRARLAAAVDALRARSQRVAADAVALAQRGAVLAAVDSLRPWFDAARPEAGAVLVEALAAAGVDWPPAGRGPVDVAAGAPLPRGLAVRVRRDDALADAEVVASRGDEVTVRLTGPEGRTFPTVPRTAVESVERDGSRAADQAAAALRAGDRPLAALWLACARAGAGDAARVAELSAALAR